MGTKETSGHKMGKHRTEYNILYVEHVGDMLNIQYVYVVNLKNSWFLEEWSQRYCVASVFSSVCGVQQPTTPWHRGSRWPRRCQDCSCCHIIPQMHLSLSLPFAAHLAAMFTASCALAVLIHPALRSITPAQKSCTQDWHAVFHRWALVRDLC